MAADSYLVASVADIVAVDTSLLAAAATATQTAADSLY